MSGRKDRIKRCGTNLNWRPRASGYFSSSHQGAWGTVRSAQSAVLVRIAECPKSISVHYPGAMPKTDADRFRQEAEECRRLAERSPSQLDKEAWLRLAADWIKLAENAEQRQPRWLRE